MNTKYDKTRKWRRRRKIVNYVLQKRGRRRRRSRCACLCKEKGMETKLNFLSFFVFFFSSEVETRHIFYGQFSVRKQVSFVKKKKNTHQKKKKQPNKTNASKCKKKKKNTQTNKHKQTNKQTNKHKQ
jgi:hypothetical protein